MSILSSLFGSPEPVPPTAPARVLLIGPADAVRQMRRVLRGTPIAAQVVGCALAPVQHHAGAIGIPVLGSAEDLDMIVRLHHIDLACVSIPVAMYRLAQRLIAQLDELGVTVRRMPTLADQLDGRIGQHVGPIDTTRLLDRPARPLDEAAIDRTLRDRCVMISGAGGSIGSHIARIVARFNPSKIVLMDRSENGLFEIDRVLRAEAPQVSRVVLLHDVTDARRCMDLCLLHEPHVIFHAAAHKHVPMMEDHPREAMINNFFGTRAILDAAVACGAERFVMISTDKAVNPTSVMGATKRAAELYVQHIAQTTDTICSMVRFGNVLGSACSVVPIWSQQLAEGGPLTVTDPAMTRYFMTIPEAAALVIQSASLDRAQGCVFVLDMGEPVKIVDMADRFIRLHGLEPGRDVRIEFIGVRPGEKLYEELSYDSEDMLPTAHDSVRIVRTRPPEKSHVQWMLKQFERLRHSDDRAAILEALKRAVPQMQPRLEVSPTIAGEVRTPEPLIRSA
ncbi:MAG: NAD-dependent epimerase/dehydratase family protein [Planctomycetes bacterium]|nr:NAD-dependent epimerase/dehydratase family protein [Planctomycetota bacterium]